MAVLSRCISQIGKKAFNAAYIELATSVLRADQCMIFSYEGEEPRCFLSYNTRPDGEARALAEKYVTFGYTNDPFFQIAKTTSTADAVQIFDLNGLKGRMDQEYLQAFFEKPGLVDKVAISVRKGSLHLCLNFYRYAETGPYSREFLEKNEGGFEVAAHLAALHYQSSSDHSLEDPLLTLSEREQEVCRWILKGLTTDAIAAEMDLSPNTISTFRRRAYDKLAINSKTALFALCQE